MYVILKWIFIWQQDAKFSSIHWLPKAFGIFDKELDCFKDYYIFLIGSDYIAK